MDSENRLLVAKAAMAVAEHTVEQIDEPAGILVLVFNSKGDQTILTSLESSFQLVKLLRKALERAVALDEAIESELFNGNN